MSEQQSEYNIISSGTAAQRVYAYICRHKAQHDGNAPTLREIAVGAGLAGTSTATVRAHLRRLRRAGLIRLPQEGSARGIEVVGAAWTPPGGDNSHSEPANRQAGEPFLMNGYSGYSVFRRGVG